MTIDWKEHTLRDLDETRTTPVELQRERRDERLARLVRHHYENPRNGAYRAFLAGHGVQRMDELPTRAEDLSRLPIVDKAMLRRSGYAERPAVPEAEVKWRVMTSGSTGAPLSVPQSAAFSRWAWAHMICRTAVLAGRPEVVGTGVYAPAHFTATMRNSASYVGFAELTSHFPGSRFAATSDPIERHIEGLRAPEIGWSVGGVGFYVGVAAAAAARGLSLCSDEPRLLLVGGAAVTPEHVARLRAAYGQATLVTSIYGGSEIGVQGIGRGQPGEHLLYGDHTIFEIVDDEGRAVAPGQRGRLLFTMLASDAAPLIRYANGDMARLVAMDDEYPLFPIIDDLGRDLTAFIGDAKLTFDDIEQLPRRMSAAGVPVSGFQMVKRRGADGRDEVLLRIERATRDQSEETLRDAAIAALRSHLQLDYHLKFGEMRTPEVEVHPPGALSAGLLKLPLFVDETRRS